MLRLAADNGRLLLIVGLAVGVLSPLAATTLRPWLPQMIAALLCLASFRIGGRLSLGSGPALRRALTLVVTYQVIAPLLALAVLAFFGASGTVAAAALALMLAAPSLTASPNFTILLGHDPAMPLRMLLLGTALLPLTAVPVLSLVPDLVSTADVRQAALNLALVIAGTVAVAFATRALAGAARAAQWQRQIDGLSAILMTLLVVGLMTAIGPALRHEPMMLLAWLGFAFAANFGLQILAWFALSRLPEAERVGAAFIAGNRNMALFLVALPPETTDALLLFIGCYQVPMYLTPMLLGRLYRPRRA